MSVDVEGSNWNDTLVRLDDGYLLAIIISL